MVRCGWFVWCASVAYRNRGLLLMIPAGVVAVGVSWHRMCFPCPCRPRGVQPGLPCGPRSFFKCVCRDMRRTPEAGARLARYAGNASLCMRGHARAGGCSGGPVVPRCLPPGLCMPPHTRRNGSPKAIIFGSRMPCLSCVWCLTCRFMVGVCDGGLSRCAGVVCPGMGFASRVRHALS